jgi:hypothetical protein
MAFVWPEREPLNLDMKAIPTVLISFPTSRIHVHGIEKTLQIRTV